MFEVNKSYITVKYTVTRNQDLYALVHLHFNLSSEFSSSSISNRLNLDGVK